MNRLSYFLKNKTRRCPALSQIGHLVLLSVFFFLSACSNTKYLAQNQSLLVSSKLNLKGNLSKSERENIRNSLTSSSIILQKPNTKFLNLLRLKLWLYNKKYNDKKTGKIWNWLLINKNMEPPVIFDSSKSQKSVANMVSFLNNQGFFYAAADFTARTKKKKTGVTYQVNTGMVFQIDSIGYDIPDTTIRKAVIASSKESFLKKGDPFKAETAVSERNRITDVVRDAGFYQFSDEDVRFVVDTINKSIFKNIFDPFDGFPSLVNESNPDKQPRLDLTIQILNPTDTTKYKAYYIRNIYVYPDYSAYSLPDSALYTHHKYKDLDIRYNKDIIRPRVLKNAIQLESGKLYSQTRQFQTIRRLNSLGVWKFVNVELDTLKGMPDSLDCYIFLIPGKKQELGANIETTTSGNDYIIGGALNLTYQNNNTHRAANQLKIGLKSGIEWNSDSARAFFVQAREYSGNATLSFPRFITPFKINDVGRFSDPQTNLGLGFNYLNRLNFFSLTSFNGSFGYNWNETAFKKWIVSPFSLNYNHISNISSAFKQQLETNPFLKNSFSSVFIEGENASFIFNNQVSSSQAGVNYLRINFEESGLLLNGIDAAIRGFSGGKTSFGKLTSVNYSQYMRLDAEYKHYFNRRHSTLVMRAYGGIGIPYGKSSVLPYIKQFTAGGPNSMRAWRLRSLGPGSYFNPDVNKPDVFPDQTGEMKLEGNVEYRFDIMNLFTGFMKIKGAVFVDAGNIWNLHENPYKPGSEFQPDRFYQDIAIGSGVGLRLDFSYAVLRLDVGTPLKEPYISDNYGWILKTLRPWNGRWRKNNLVFNFAVGYPF